MLDQHTRPYMLSLGSSSPNGHRYIQKAINLIADIPDISITGETELIHTQPFGGRVHNSFINTALMAQVSCSPQILWQRLAQVEKQCGRIRGRRNGHRLIDIDIVWAAGLDFKSRNLRIPHIGLQDRIFWQTQLFELRGLLQS